MVAFLILTTYFPRLVRGARPSPTLGRRVFQTTALSVLKVPNNFRRRRLISVNFIIKRLFDILGVEYKIIPITQSKNTLRYCENWWERVYSLIKADISRLVSQNLDRK